MQARRPFPLRRPRARASGAARLRRHRHERDGAQPSRQSYEAVHNEAIALITELLGVPDDYDVLFLQGGASQQFADGADEPAPRRARAPTTCVTGGWSREGLRRGAAASARCASRRHREGRELHAHPGQSELELNATRPTSTSPATTRSSARSGTTSRTSARCRSSPTCRATSLWSRFDVSNSRSIYAGAQKNIGPSGSWSSSCARISSRAAARTSRRSSGTDARRNNSLYNTPPTFAIYLVRNVLA